MRFLHAGFLLLTLSALSAGQGVGTSLPAEIELADFAQTKAESYDDLFGRTVLIEFFAYW